MFRVLAAGLPTLARASGRRLVPAARLLTAPITAGVRPAPLVRSLWDEAAPRDHFERRHNAASEADVQRMLKTIGNFRSLEDLTSNIVPKSIRLEEPLKGMPEQGMAEHEFLALMKEVASQNKPEYKSLIGMGYYDTITPPVILRNVLENPQWYTPYTPYQAEIAQGRLESLLNFQTMVSDLTGMPVANASLLDEATAAAEAMALAWRSVPHGQDRPVFVVDSNVHPQTLSVLLTRAEPLGIQVTIGSLKDIPLSDKVFGVLLQYPASDGAVGDVEGLIKKAHAAGAQVAVATDLLALTLLKSPGELGADVAFGSAQRFGIPLGYGGPHPAFFAAQRKHLRTMPGRVVGVTRDSRGLPALRMALQTREQHIRRERATSNICTAQALLANTSALYAMYHGPDGLRAIAERVHGLAVQLAACVQPFGVVNENKLYFDTLKLNVQHRAAEVISRAREAGYNLRDFGDGVHVGVSFDETSTATDVAVLADVFASAMGVAEDVPEAPPGNIIAGSPYHRTSKYLTAEVFNAYHAEHEMLRYIFRLCSKDVALTQSMIPLGSCTMKLNATAEMIPLTWPEFGRIHPFAPLEQAQGYAQMTEELSRALCAVTGFAAVSLQPNSGAQGEFAGLLTIRQYLKSIGQGHRHICLIPQSAHGTNPASAAMCGMKVVAVKCLPNGSIDVDDLRSKAEAHAAQLACVMVTYPSTYGVFEDTIREVVDIVHRHGGQVYMDGANMNAQVGLCSPGHIGADVCHLNLHKTFCIPHGGGGPGMGPIGVAAHLVPFLPTHPSTYTRTSNPLQQAVGAVSAAPYSSASILTISYAYIRMMGARGLRAATQRAILNANYMKARLAEHYSIAFVSDKGHVAHEFIIDLRPFKATAGIEAIDVAKRLQDYGFHAPTVSWPVPGSLMIEPTESESKAELDRYCDALILIRKEIRDIEEGRADKVDNVLKGAPHTADMVASSSWNRKYTREQAAYPAPWSKTNKYWPVVGRVDDVYGDRNVVCTCPSVEELAAIHAAADTKA